MIPLIIVFFIILPIALKPLKGVYKIDKSFIRYLIILVIYTALITFIALMINDTIKAILLLSLYNISSSLILIMV